MPHLIHRRLVRWLLAALLLGTAVLAGAAHEIAAQIFSPARRGVPAAQADKLVHPARYGLRIREYGCLHGAVPCLLVEPQLGGIPVAAALQLRRQLIADGTSLPRYGDTQGIIVLLHGRHGRKEDLLPVAARFAAIGYRCLLPDLPGHGDSPLPRVNYGATVFESSLPRRILVDAEQHFNLPRQPAALWGVSMGGAFAVSAAAEAPQQWQALIVVSSFDAMDPLLREHGRAEFGWLGSPLTTLVDDANRLEGGPALASMRPMGWARQVQAATLMLHGDQDQVIPLADGRRLFRAIASTDKRWITVAHADHHTVLRTAAPLYAQMSGWLLQHLPPKEEDAMLW